VVALRRERTAHAGFEGIGGNLLRAFFNFLATLPIIRRPIFISLFYKPAFTLRLDMDL
jgi:hypothetical protein